MRLDGHPPEWTVLNTMRNTLPEFLADAEFKDDWAKFPCRLRQSGQGMRKRPDLARRRRQNTGGYRRKYRQVNEKTVLATCKIRGGGVYIAR